MDQIRRSHIRGDSRLNKAARTNVMKYNLRSHTVFDALVKYDFRSSKKKKRPCGCHVSISLQMIIKSFLIESDIINTVILDYFIIFQ